MPNKRDSVLDATLQAELLHRELKTREQLQKGSASVDVFSIILQLEIDLVFRPLQGLLGAFVPEPSPGILVTTERQLSIQRFTAAHELGHFWMKHELSLDDEGILRRNPFISNRYSLQEVAADSFAAMFLMPEWLVAHHAEKQHWNWQSLSDPSNIYQLSLRMGTSYEAMANALFKYGTLDRSTFDQVAATQPKKIKRGLLGAYEIEDWRPNVWLLTERDQGTVIHGEPNDIFIVQLKEQSSAGYLWNLDQLKREGFVVVNDERRVPPAEEGIGGAVDRVLTARSQAPLLGEISAVHARPWDSQDSIAYFSFGYDLRGKESGMSRVERERPVAA